MYLKEYTQLTIQEKRQNLYKEKYKKKNPKWDDSMVLLTKYFKDYAKSNSNILDIGCGNGNWIIDELPSKFDKKIGIDLDKQAIRNNKTLDKIKLGSIEQIPFNDDSFDNAISLWVLEHLKNPNKGFKEVQRILKKGGLFGFVTPYKYYLPITIKRILNTNYSNKIVTKLYGREDIDIFKAYYKSNTINDIKKISNENNFEILKLHLNFDPSYTSFNSLTYKITNFINKTDLNIFKAHIVGLLRKK